MTGRLSGVARKVGRSRGILVRLALVLPALLVVWLASPVMADRLKDRGTAEERAACTPDVFRLCSRFIPSESRIVACLMESRAQLSPACGRVFGVGGPRQAGNASSSRRAAQQKKKTTKKSTTSRTTKARKPPAKKPI